MKREEFKELFKRYIETKEKLKEYRVVRDTVGKVFDVDSKESIKINIKKDSIFAKSRKVSDKPLLFELLDKRYDNLRFYILAKRLRWNNEKEVNEKMKGWLEREKKNGK